MRAIAITITIAARMKWLTGTLTSKRVTVSLGRIEGRTWGLGPKASRIAACAMSRIPSEATSLASGEAVRRGRKASSSIARPIASETTIVKRKETGAENSGPNTPVLKAQ